jgi:hypothetical protein
MKRLGAILLVLALGGCGTIQGMWKPKPRAAAAPACPAGQENLRTAQLFLGRQAPGAAIAPWDLQRFVEQEITPRFPDGVTVLDGGAQWKGSENILIRDAAKVVLIVLPARGDTQGRVEAVRAAYRQRFNQDSVVVVTPPACVEF